MNINTLLNEELIKECYQVSGEKEEGFELILNNGKTLYILEKETSNSEEEG